MLKPPPPLSAAAMQSLRRLLLLPRSRFPPRLHLTPLRRLSDQPPPDPSTHASLAAWAAYDPFADRLLDRDSAAASDSEAAARVYDPISGELVVLDPTAPDLDAGAVDSEGEAVVPSAALVLDSISGELVLPDPTAPNLDAADSVGEAAVPSVALVYDPISGELVLPDSTAPNLDAAAADSEGEAAEFDPLPDEPPPAPPVAVPEKPRRGGVGFPASGAGLAEKKKSGKGRVSWVCAECGEVHSQWWGFCQSCKAMGSINRFSESGVLEPAVRSWLPGRLVDQMPVRLTDVNLEKDQSNWRMPLSGHFGMEVARVLGGGVVPGSLVLVGGDPGVGKSTLLLQVAANLAYGHDSDGPVPVLYVSGEESIDQIRNRANRMSMNPPNLFLYSSTDIEDILEKTLLVSPRPQVIIVDSIQTVYLKGVTGSAGNIVQVKECTSALLRYAKQTSIPIFLIGHVTKSGDIAGPRMLEHIVDTVLYMEGERYSSYRLLRSVKNRFGSTDELGVLEMLESGLQAVSNPSEMFLSERIESDILAGLAVAVIVEGSRAFLIEIQALCAPGTSSARHFNGVTENRAGMIISVLMKQAGLKLQDSAIYINVVSGIKLTETAGDLAIAIAIWSSLMEIRVPNNIAFIGEIGLGGELRGVVRTDKRVMAVAKLGYKKCIIPKSVEKSLASLSLDIEIVACTTVKDVFDVVLDAL